MKKLLFLILISVQICASAETVYVLGEASINNTYEEVKRGLAACEGVEVKKEIRGVVVSLELENPKANYYHITPELEKKLTCVEYFLAKIKNPVIIEVHTDKVPEGIKGKNWEFSSVIAGNVGDVFLKHEPAIPSERIYLVGYGEFMPAINTSNNGGNYSNRIDIIIRSSIDGE